MPGFREMSAVLARRIPGAAYHLVAGAGHMVSMEQPAAINDLLISFVQGASWTRGSTPHRAPRSPNSIAEEPHDENQE